MNGLRLYRYRLPLRLPLTLQGQSLQWREGLLLQWESDDGQVVWGEAAPLPGFSLETLSQVIAAAQVQQWHRYPSLEFATSGSNQSTTPTCVPVSALIMGDLAAAEQQIERLAELPHTTVKIKVGRRGCLRREIDLVRQACAVLRSDQQLRLDANRSWDLEAALQFGLAVRDCPIEYIEEPTSNPDEFERIRAETGLSYALDESLRELLDWRRFPHAAAIIIKPTLQGDVRRLFANVPAHVPRIFSSAFESGIGLLAIARLAEHFAPGIPVGLDTYRWLEHDLMSPCLSMEDGTLDLGAAAKSLVEVARMEELKW